MDSVDRVRVLLLSDRDYPIAQVKLPKHVIEDINNLVENAQRLNPTLTPDEVVRAIWRLGSRQVRNNLSRGIAPKLDELPPPASVPDKPEKDEEPNGQDQPSNS